MDANISTKTMSKTKPVQNLLRYISFKTKVFQNLNKNCPLVGKNSAGVSSTFYLRKKKYLTLLHRTLTLWAQYPRYTDPGGARSGVQHLHVITHAISQISRNTIKNWIFENFFYL